MVNKQYKDTYDVRLLFDQNMVHDKNYKTNRIVFSLKPSIDIQYN